MPWLPELFTAPALQRVLDERRRDTLVAVPYFDGLMAGDPGPLVESFAGEPEVLDPVRGRVKGASAFRGFVTEASAWLRQHHASVEDVEHVILGEHGFEEVVLRFDSDRGTVSLPVAVVADRRPDGLIDEVRVYFSSRLLTGRPATRSPVLQPDPDLRPEGIVGQYLRAVADGEADAMAATFEPGGLDGDAFYGRVARDGGIPLETCAQVDDGRTCALEYNVVRRGPRWLPPQAGVAVFARAGSGKLASVRVYDDLESPGP